MVNEVESILREIREQVRAEEEQRALITPTGNGLGPQANGHHVTGRAWDRLPPVFSKRRGTAARLELWIKAKMKSITRWFTWEQLNFNSAVHHALGETLEILKVQTDNLKRMRAELARKSEELETLSARFDSRINLQIAEIRTLTTRLDAQCREAAEAGAAMEQSQAEIRSRLAEVDARLTEILDQWRDEQRVCFDQLSLRTTEAVVREDRGRRAIEARLDKLEKTLSGRRK